MSVVARRSFLTGLASLVAAPAVIRTPGLLMPVRGLVETDWMPFTADELRRLGEPGVWTKVMERIYLVGHADFVHERRFPASGTDRVYALPR